MDVNALVDIIEGMPELVLARALRGMAQRPDLPVLVERLKRQPAQPWIALAGALEEIRRLEARDG